MKQSLGNYKFYEKSYIVNKPRMIRLEDIEDFLGDIKKFFLEKIKKSFQKYLWF